MEPLIRVSKGVSYLVTTQPTAHLKSHVSTCMLTGARCGGVDAASMEAQGPAGPKPEVFPDDIRKAMVQCTSSHYCGMTLSRRWLPPHTINAQLNSLLHSRQQNCVVLSCVYTI